MNDEQIEAILNALPARRPPSRLEPYAQLIDQLRKLGLTYREIEEILLEKCGIHAPRSTINDFVRRRSLRKGSKIQTLRPPKGKNGKMPATARPKEKEVSWVESGPSALDDVYKRITVLKQRPAPIAKTTEVFHYDPNEPLQLPNKSEPRKPRE